MRFKFHRGGHDRSETHMRDRFEFGPRSAGPGGRFGPHSEGRGRGGRHGRPFDHGDLRLVVLKLISETPRHGYELIKALDELTGGAYSPSPGVIYPTLALLEEMDLVAAVEVGAKKSYAVTNKGLELLEANSALLKLVFERIAAMKADAGSEPPPELVRAMQNLRAALQVRLRRGALSREDLGRLTAIIDSAATDIERL